MGHDVAIVSVRGQVKVDRDGTAALHAQAVAGDGQRAGVAQATGDDLGNRRGEHLVAVEIQELDGAGDLNCEARAGERPAVEERAEGGRDGAETIAPLEIPRGAPLGDEGRAVLGLLDHLAFAVVALVVSDAGGSVEHADGDVVRHERQGAVGVVRRHGVPVGVEADERLGVGAGRLDPVRVGQRLGQREEAVALLGEHVGDRPGSEHGVRAGLRDLGEEAQELGVALGNAGDGPPGEEPVAQVADGPLDPALVLRPSHRAEARLDAHPPAKVEEHGVEAHRVAASLQHDDLGVIEEPLARDAAEGAGGAHQRPGERVHGEVKDELAPQGPRMREHDDEEPERPLPAGHGNLADVGPVDLCLLAGEWLGAQVQLAPWLGPNLGHVFAQGADRAGVAPLGEHVVEPGGAQARVAGQRLGDECAVRIDEPRPRRSLGARLPEPEDAADHVGVDSELPGDGADAPVLRVVQTEDLRLGLRRRHRSPRRLSWRRSLKEPRPRRRRRGSNTSTS